MSRTPQAVRACAEWLVGCLRLGWSRTDLDALEALWWKYHDDTGHLTCSPTMGAGGGVSAMSQPTQKAYDDLCAGYDTVMVSLQDAEAELAARTQERDLAIHERNVAEDDSAKAIDQLEALRSTCQALAIEMRERAKEMLHQVGDGIDTEDVEEMEGWAERLTNLSV